MTPTWLHAAILGIAAVSTTVTADPIVKLEESKITVRGITKGPIEEFLNVRFAHDTSGSRRFAPPVPYTYPEKSDVDATSPGPACAQSEGEIPPFFASTPDISEDCLNLRISRPAGTAAGDKLPVVVHLVGGGVVKGSTYDPHFDPDNLLTLSTSLGKPIIHVVINYRLNIFGFARLPILKDQKSLNVGMRDQRCAFQWIKDNIAAFGGDPNRITSFGLSSGGTFSSLHLMTYGGEQGVPFNQIWTMSGPPGTALNITSDAVELHTRAVAEKVGCGDDSTDDEELLKCLREVPMDKLTETAMAYSVANHPPAGLFTFITSVDDDFLPDRQSVLYKAGKFVKGIPIVFGWTQDDGAMNAGFAPTFQTEESIKTPIKNFAHALTDDDYTRLFSLYPASDFEQESQSYEARKELGFPDAPVHYFRASRILRDMLFTCSSIDFGFEVTRQSRVLDPSFAGVRFYDLNQSIVAPLFRAAGMPYVGVVHGSDMDFIYDHIFPRVPELSEEDAQLTKSLAASFINFAYTGNPSHIDTAGDDGFKSWPESFPESSGGLNAESASGPSGLNVQLIGGPLGTGICHLRDKAAAFAGQEGGSMQDPLVDSTQFGEMETAAYQVRKRELEREKLFERCSFINTLAEKLGH